MNVVEFRYSNGVVEDQTCEADYARTVPFQRLEDEGSAQGAKATPDSVKVFSEQYLAS